MEVISALGICSFYNDIRLLMYLVSNNLRLNYSQIPWPNLFLVMLPKNEYSWQSKYFSCYGKYSNDKALVLTSSEIKRVLKIPTAVAEFGKISLVVHHNTVKTGLSNIAMCNADIQLLCNESDALKFYQGLLVALF